MGGGVGKAVIAKVKAKQVPCHEVGIGSRSLDANVLRRDVVRVEDWLWRGRSLVGDGVSPARC